MKYIYSEEEAIVASKSGIDLKVYGQVSDDVSFVRGSVEEGHQYEFQNTSWFIYYIISGNGTFVLNDEEIAAKEGDIVAIPPNTRIYYYGKMDFTLTVTPPWKEENETIIREVELPENGTTT